MSTVSTRSECNPATATEPASSCSVASSVRHRAAVHPGVQPVVESADLDAAVDQATQRRGQSRLADRPVRRVGEDKHISRELLAVAVEEGVEGRRADFLLAFDQDRDADSDVFAQRADRREVDADPGLVVCGAAPEQAPVDLGGLERIGLPVLPGPRRLHVVVSVKAHGRCSWRCRPVPDYCRQPAVDRQDLDVGEPGDAQELRDVFGAAVDVAAAGRIGADRRDPNQSVQIGAHKG